MSYPLYVATDRGWFWPVTWNAAIAMPPRRSIRLRRVCTYDTRGQATEGQVVFERLNAGGEHVPRSDQAIHEQTCEGRVAGRPIKPKGERDATDSRRPTCLQGSVEFPASPRGGCYADQDRSRTMHIDAYEFGRITIDGVAYEYDLVLDGKRIRKRKKRPSK